MRWWWWWWWHRFSANRNHVAYVPSRLLSWGHRLRREQDVWARWRVVIMRFEWRNRWLMADQKRIFFFSYIFLNCFSNESLELWNESFDEVSRGLVGDEIIMHKERVSWGMKFEDETLHYWTRVYYPVLASYPIKWNRCNVFMNKDASIWEITGERMG